MLLGLVIAAGLVTPGASGPATPAAQAGDPDADQVEGGDRSGWDLRVAGESGCAELAQLGPAIAHHLRKSTRQIEATSVVVSLSEGDDEAGFELSVSIEGGPHHQRHLLVSTRCSDLVDSAALLIAVTLDPLVLSADKAPTPDTQAADTAKPTPLQAQGPALDQARNADALEGDAPQSQARPDDERRTQGPPSRRGFERSTPHRLGLAFRSTLGTGVTPALNFGLSLAMPIRLRPHLSLSLGAHHAFERVRRETGASSGIGVQASTARLRLCAHVWPSSVDIALCGGANAGAMFARSDDVSPQVNRTVAWGTATAGAGLRWPRDTPIALAFDIEGWVAFDRATFKFPGVVGVYRPDAIGVQALLGLDLRFEDRRDKASHKP